jgi:hypothetical protein
MIPIRHAAAALGILFLGLEHVDAAPAGSVQPTVEAAAKPRSGRRPEKALPPSDAIPGAQMVKPPPSCRNGTLRTFDGNLVCR